MLGSVSLQHAANAVAPPTAAYWPLYIILVFFLAAGALAGYFWLKKPKESDPHDGENKLEHQKMGDRLDNMSKDMAEIKLRQVQLEASHAAVQREVSAVREAIGVVHSRIDDLFKVLADMARGK